MLLNPVTSGEQSRGANSSPCQF